MQSLPLLLAPNSGDVAAYTRRDEMGRGTSQTIGHGTRTISEKSYQWGVNNKLLSIVDNGQITNFEYDTWGNLAKTTFEDGKVEYRNPDKSGNLFERPDRFDRTYTKGGQLVRTEKWEYKYDSEGNLIRKKAKDGQTWRYEWNQAGMLARVKRPDAKEVTFRYDALGRRIEKRFNNNVTHWLWDGNVPLHEWKESEVFDFMGQADDLTTWVFEEGTFVLAAKIKGNKKLSIVTNYMGTPEAMYDENGSSTWSCSLSSYGRVRNFEGHHKTDCPFRYQGQYEDSETGLYYNRFRYYSPEEGMYISQDPIRLRGNNPTFYGYVSDPNIDSDAFGLTETSLNPNEINYSQRTVSDIRVWDESKYSPIRVMRTEDGGYVSYNNRRLLAAQNAGLDSIKVEIVDPDAPHPDSTTGKTWREKFRERFRDKRNRDEDGNPVPEEGLSEKPTCAGSNNK